MANRWGQAGISELLQVQETAIPYPSASGGQFTRTLQRSGLLSKLRFQLSAQLSVSAFTGAPGKSVYGVLGSVIQRMRVEANGSVPLVDLSGLGLTMYNEIQNRDGSPLFPIAIDATNNNIAGGASLMAYPAVGATGEFLAKFPFEINFALPVNINQRVSELGLWLLQNQSIDVGINVNFNALYAAVANVNNLYSGGTITATGNTAASKLEIERELYTLPQAQEDYPDLTFAHTIQEFSRDILGNFCRFEVPRAGLLLRAFILSLDSSGLPVEHSDISELSWTYGANEKPISRPGKFVVQEFEQDYSRYPIKGMVGLDFYKWGREGLKFVKSTEELANLRIETTYSTTATGRQVILLERLIPVAGR